MTTPAVGVMMENRRKENTSALSTPEPSASFAFRQARLALRVGRLQEAARGFAELVERGSTDPLHLSYHGLLLAQHDKRGKEGQALCLRAFLLAPDNAEIRMNLARIYVLRGAKDKAVTLLRAGMRDPGSTRGVRAELNRLSPRRTPPLRWWSRDHVLNKLAGKLVARWFG